MNCYYVASDQPRYVRNRHDEDCPTTTWHAPLAWVDCAGCQECEDRHCLIQWHGDRGDCQTHAESVCPACVGKVREHIAEIVRLSGFPLIEQLLSAGRTDTEAAHLAGPAANPHQWRQRGDHGHIYDPESRMGGMQPLWILGKYDLLVTEHLGHKRRTGKITIPRAASYLGRNLTWLAADLEFDFVDMATDLEECRQHLERVVHDGEQVETGAPCMTCRIPLRLVRGEREDRWTCPRCRQESTEEQYRFALRADFIENATDLNADDMAVRTEVPASTIRRWAHVRRTQRKGEKPIDHPPIIKPTGRVNERKVYAVVDVEFVRDNGGEALRDSPDAPAARSVA